jgi:hypothetical protein
MSSCRSDHEPGLRSAKVGNSSGPITPNKFILYFSLKIIFGYVGGGGGEGASINSIIFGTCLLATIVKRPKFGNEP